MPVLWDKETQAIVSNESADMVRMLDAWATPGCTRRATARRSRKLNAWIYRDLQNGVYRAGFARSQEAYDEAFDGVFAALDGSRRYSGSAATWPATA